MRQDPGSSLQFFVGSGGAIAQPAAVIIANLKEVTAKQATNIALVQPEIQGIARNFALP
jgi:hypothetical protein